MNCSFFGGGKPDLISSHSITERNLKLLLRLHRRILIDPLLMGLSFRGFSLSPRCKQLPVRNLDVAQSWWVKCWPQYKSFSLLIWDFTLEGQNWRNLCIALSKLLLLVLEGCNPETSSLHAFLLLGTKCNAWLDLNY